MPFQYQPRSPESFKARENFRDGGSFDRMFDRDVTMFKPSSGDNNVRILPATWENPDHYGYDMYVHYGVGPDRSSYLSLWKHHGQPDPIDEASAAAARDGNDKLERELRATRRVAVWLIDRAEEDKGPQLWLSPATSFDRDVITQSRDRQTGEVLAVDDPENGYDIFFHKSGEKLATKYEGVSVARRSTPLHIDPATKERWLEHVVANPIPSMLKFYPYERIAAVFNGEALSGGMEEVAPAVSNAPAAPPTAPPVAAAAPVAPPAAQTPPAAPTAAYTPQTPPTAPTPPPAAHAAPTPPPAPPAAHTPPTAPPVAAAPVAPPAAQAQPQPPTTPPAADLPPAQHRTRPSQAQEFGDVPY